MKEQKNKFISLITGISIVAGIMSASVFASYAEKTVGGFDLEIDSSQYIFFGEVPDNGMYTTRARGRDILWQVRDDIVLEKDVLSISTNKKKIQRRDSKVNMKDYFTLKEGNVIKNKEGDIIEVKEKIKGKVKEEANNILDKILNKLKQKYKEEQEEKEVSHIKVDIPVSSIIYKSSGNWKWCELGEFKLVNRLNASKNKLTLLDEERNNFKVAEEEISAKPGDNIDLNYHNAVAGEEGGSEYISAIIKDRNGDALYYGKFENTTCEEGIVSIKMPKRIKAGEYELMILTEEENGIRRTNYAGFDIVRLTIKK
ncbi:MAG: hypothetical protein J6Y29_01310 [Clostridiales bacterium]|nr:hypothetical protein [Clostridiales bacterium]